MTQQIVINHVVVSIPDGFEAIMEDSGDAWDELIKLEAVQQLCLCGHTQENHVSGISLCMVHPTEDTICQCQKFELAGYVVAVADIPDEIKAKLEAEQHPEPEPEPVGEPEPMDEEAAEGEPEPEGGDKPTDDGEPAKA